MIMKHGKHELLPLGALIGSTAILIASLTMSPTGTAAAAPATAKALLGNPVRGRSLYQSCAGCHSLDENEVGPKHRGVVGRRAAAVPGYTYSAALKKSNVIWDKPTLDRWLAGPQKVVPGSKMFFSVNNAQNRADIIAYLAQQR
jgi:cytochrome c